MTTKNPKPALPSSGLDLPYIKTGQRLTGAERETFAKKVVGAYQTPGRKVTIREICEKTNRSYGAIHSILSQARATKHGRRPAGASGPVAQ
ncbi:helix-turn-helix domain-containing protein [Streptomyces sp. NBC_01527]|uniref:helix-turn-helix domain-containing protein n=1 Tax=Streptomyces sp. NBC_01527 TaxID=2903894 RepID=UPI00386A01BA